ncbi:hypothetical protein [Dendronalium sp. ChiSLP03b]|uniref:hypothetical protein n=1 Tax=Dendronalium sp. ChiSLP03b TaxID=3075381 RepID=UPI00391CEF48
MNITEVKIQPDAYLKIIEGRLVKINPEFARVALGKQCRLINLETDTFMYRYLHSTIDEYGYWVKRI